MSQRALATVAGVPQSLIAKIESGSRQPSIPTLTRLIEASGFTMETQLSNAVRPSILLATFREKLHELAIEYGISRVRVFGSVARGEDNAESDLDLLVDVDPSADPLLHLGFAEAAGRLLNCRVDVVTTSGLHPLLAKTILAEARDLEAVGR